MYVFDSENEIISSDVQPFDRSWTVGAMFYISPTLTMLMLGVVPPVSLGAVSPPSRSLFRLLT